LKISHSDLGGSIDGVRDSRHIDTEKLPIHEQEALGVSRVWKPRKGAMFQCLDVGCAHPRGVGSLLDAELSRLARLRQLLCKILIYRAHNKVKVVKKRDCTSGAFGSLR
jgi:hypothetical protein